ncbi:MAG: hypothetical protein LUC20_06890, partial [Oscillospiraceae bacterium]|nr:hypothetical protein [Oscillospiraceae bacterium]
MPRKKAAAEDMPETAIDENAEAPQEVVNEEAPDSAESVAEAEMPAEEHTSENAELRISDDMELMSAAKNVILEEPAALPPDIPEADAPAEVQNSHEEQNTEAHSFYDLNLNALDRDLSPEERREWNSIYASYRGRSALTGTIVGVDRHTVSARDRETGEAERQEMYCAVIIPFRVRILIPASEMWFVGEERPAFVLRNTVGASRDFKKTPIDREGTFA